MGVGAWSQSDTNGSRLLSRAKVTGEVQQECVWWCQCVPLTRNWPISTRGIFRLLPRSSKISSFCLVLRGSSFLFSFWKGWMDLCISGWHIQCLRAGCPRYRGQNTELSGVKDLSLGRTSHWSLSACQLLNWCLRKTGPGDMEEKAECALLVYFLSWADKGNK